MNVVQVVVVVTAARVMARERAQVMVKERAKVSVSGLTVQLVMGGVAKW